MKAQMTSRERLLAAINREEVDHIPLGQIFHSTIMGTPDQLQWSDQFQRARVMKDLGLDPVIDIWLPAPEPPVGVQVRRWQEKDPGEPSPLLCAEYQTPAGKLIQKVRKTDDWYDRTHYNFLPDWQGNSHRPQDRFDQLDMLDDWFTRRYKVPLVKGPQDLEALSCLLQPPRGQARDRWIQHALQAKKIAAEMDLLTHARRVSVGDWFMWVCLIEDFCLAMIEDPQYVADFFAVIQNYNKQVLELVLEVQPDVIQYRGWYDTPDYWGLQRHRDLLAPKIQELARLVHSVGSKFCYLLPEGYTLYKDILRTLDVDVFLGLDPLAARKSEDLCHVKKALGDHSCLWGGVNACVTVGTGSDRDIDTAVRTAIETLGPRGFILNASIYFYDDDVTWERFMTLVEAWRKYA